MDPSTIESSASAFLVEEDWLLFVNDDEDDDDEDEDEEAVDDVDELEVRLQILDVLTEMILLKGLFVNSDETGVGG